MHRSTACLDDFRHQQADGFLDQTPDNHNKALTYLGQPIHFKIAKWLVVNFANQGQRKTIRESVFNKLFELVFRPSLLPEFSDSRVVHPLGKVS